MKKLLITVLSVLLLLSTFGLVACSSGAPQNPYVESDITNGLNITDTTFNYSLSVNGATTIVVVDGDAVSKKIGDQTTSIFKQGTKFYTYAVNEYWANSTKYNSSTGQNGQGDKIVWDKTYYTPSEIKTDGENQRNAIRDLYKEYIPDLTGKFEQFSFDGEKLVASSVVVDDVTYSNLEISFYGDENNPIKSISYVLNLDAQDMQSVLITFAYYYKEIDKPENLTSYYGDDPSDLVANAPSDTFLLKADNFVCFYEDLYSQQNIKIEKAGDLIKHTTYNVQQIKVEEYYQKDGTNYYKYTKSNGVWSATTCTQADYEEKENLMYTMVCLYNSHYANCKTNFSGFMSSGDIAAYYSVAGSSGGAKSEHYTAIYVANDKVEKIVVRGTGSSSKNFYYEFSFEYGTTVINLPVVD